MIVIIMKKIILFLILLFEYTSVLSQQNLVPNHSFEELKKCPDNVGDLLH